MPLKIVLGSFAQDQNALFIHNRQDPTTYILGTSSYDFTKFKKLNKEGRVPMEDRKGPFDHFRPKSLVLSVSDEPAWLILSHDLKYCTMLNYQCSISIDHQSNCSERIDYFIDVLFGSTTVRATYGRISRLGRINSA